MHGILEVTPGYTLDEYKEPLVKSYTELGLSEKEIKTRLKYSKRVIEGSKNINGSIRFDLYEYEDSKASSAVVDTGTISIKTSEGKKIRASIAGYALSNGSATITGYKELTGGLYGVKNKT